jgi:uncharacterized membrane protein
LIYGNLRGLVNTPGPESPPRDLAFREELGGFSLILKRNCSISPAGLLHAYAGLSIVVLGIGAGFALAGAWPVLPFAGLEVLGLGAALVLYARHAADYERIVLDRGRLVVEVAEAERRMRYELDPRSVRVRVEKGAGERARVLLQDGKEELEVGRHLDAEARVRFAAELEKRLRI